MWFAVDSCVGVLLRIDFAIFWVSSDHFSVLGNDLQRKKFLLLYTWASVSCLLLATMMRDNAQVAFVVLILINAYTYHPSLIFIHPFIREFSGESCVGSGGETCL
jgi:hypothetical protein